MSKLQKESQPIMIARTVAFAVLLTVINAQASSTWLPATGTNNWSVPGNWDAMPVSGVGTVLNFSNASAGSSYWASNDIPAAPFVLNQLNFSNASTTKTITLLGNALSLDGTTPAVNQNGVGAVVITNAMTLAANTTFSGSGAGGVRLNGSINGAGNLSKSGNYALTLATSNSYSGGTTLNAGSLKFLNTYALGTNILSLVGGVLTLSGVNSVRLVTPVDVVGSVAVSYDGGDNQGWNGATTGSGTLNVTNTSNYGNVRLGDLSGFSGVVNFYCGSSANTAGINGTVGTNVTLNLSGYSILYGADNQTKEVGALSGSVKTKVSMGSSANGYFTIGARGVDTLFEGTLEKLIHITKVGGGTLTLSGTNTYSGKTAVNGGVLMITGTHTNVSVYNVASNATLGGVGVIGSVVTNLLGGTVAPGTNSIGTLGTGNLTLNGKLKIRVGPAGASKVSVTGAVVLGSGADLVVEEAGQPGLGPKVIVANDGTTDAVTGQFKQGTKLSVGGNTYTLDYAGGDGNDITLTLRPKGTMIRFF